MDRRAGRIDGSSRAVVRGQTITQRHDLWPGRAAKDDAEGVEQHALGVLAHGDGDILQLGFSGKARKRFYLLAHGAAPVPLPRCEYPSAMPVAGVPAVAEVRWTSLRARGTTSGGEQEIVRQCDRPARQGGPSFLTTRCFRDRSGYKRRATPGHVSSPAACVENGAKNAGFALSTPRFRGRWCW